MADKIPLSNIRYETTLSVKISSSATSLTLDSSTDAEGTTFAGTYYLTFDEGTSKEEDMIVTLAGAAGTVVARGLNQTDALTEVSGNKYAHDRGASVKMSNIGLVRVINALNGDTALDADNRFILDVDQDATDDKEYVTQGQLNRTALGAVTSSIVLVAGTAGENITAGDLVYYDTTTANEWMLADADTAAKSENVLMGIAQGSGTDGTAITGGVLLAGLDSNQSGMTEGDIMYASDTAGAIASSAGTQEVIVGAAKSATDLYFAPRYAQELTEDQKDLLEAITASASEINQLDTATITAAQLTEAGTFFGSTDISAAEAESLTDDSTLTDKHFHKKTSGAVACTVSGSGTQEIAHGLGATPKKIKITALDVSANGDYSTTSVGTYDGTSHACAYSGSTNAAAAVRGVSSSVIITTQAVAAGATSATAAIDATNITLTWTTGITSVQMLWEAEV